MCVPSFILGDPDALRTILLYHISNGIFIGGGLETGVTNLLKTFQGSNLKVIYVSIFRYLAVISMVAWGNMSD